MIKILTDIDDTLRVVKRPLRSWKFITFHHTASTIKESDYGVHYGQIIDNMHRNGERDDAIKFQNGMGYHFLVNPDGVIEYGDRWEEQIYGAHNKGYNQISIGLAIVGNYSIPGCLPPKIQIEAARKLILKLALRVYPHRAFHDTECPGELFNDLKNWFNSIDKIPIIT